MTESASTSAQNSKKQAPKRDNETALATSDFNSLLEKVGKSQDRKAFSELFAYFAPRLKSFLISGGLSDEKAEETMQETFVTIWRKSASYDSQKAAASTWIFTVARNKKIDLIRKEKRRVIDPNDYLAIQPEQKKQIDRVQDIDNAAIIKEVIKDLPKKQSELVLKSYYESKTHQEIADELGLPLGTVKSRLRLAMEKLRRGLDQRGIESQDQ